MQQVWTRNHDAQSCRFAMLPVTKRDTTCPFVIVEETTEIWTAKEQKMPGTKYVATTEDNSSTTDEFQLYTIGVKSVTSLITIDIQINGKQLPMEVDTGAAFPSPQRKMHFPGITLIKANVVLKTYIHQQAHDYDGRIGGAGSCTSSSVNTCPLSSSLESGPVC